MKTMTSRFAQRLWTYGYHHLGQVGALGLIACGGYVILGYLLLILGFHQPRPESEHYLWADAVLGGLLISMGSYGLFRRRDRDRKPIVGADDAGCAAPPIVDN